MGYYEITQQLLSKEQDGRLLLCSLPLQVKFCLQPGQLGGFGPNGSPYLGVCVFGEKQL